MPARSGGGYRYRARREGRISPLELIAVLVVIAAVIALAVWFLFFSSGGIGPGTV